MSQFERITYIDRSLRSGGGMTIAKTAAHFEVSERQVKRDIEYMRDRLNAPIRFVNEDKVYRYAESFTRLEFADEHLLVFYSLIRSLMQNEHYIPLFSEDILDGIVGHLSRDYLPVSDRIVYQIPVAERLAIEDFTTVCQAILTHKRIDIVYVSAAGERTERRIEAERLVNYTGRWYVVAFDLMRKDFRVFHMSRIESLSITTKSCTGTGTVSRERSLKKYMESGFGIFKGPGIENAVIRIRGTAARIVARQVWHRDQSVACGEEADGTPYTDMTVPVADWTELLGRILSFGASAEPIAPDSLRRAWIEQIGAMGALCGTARAKPS